MNAKIMKADLVLLLSNKSETTPTKSELENAQTAFYDALSSQIDSTDYASAQRLLSVCEGKFNTLKREKTTATFEAKKKRTHPNLYH